VAGNLHSWNHLVLRLAHTHLRERADIFHWSLKYDGQFYISSMYHVLLDPDIVSHNSYLWKIKVFYVTPYVTETLIKVINK
jgi:hypothetical protein